MQMIQQMIRMIQMIRKNTNIWLFNSIFYEKGNPTNTASRSEHGYTFVVNTHKTHAKVSLPHSANARARPSSRIAGGIYDCDPIRVGALVRRTACNSQPAAANTAATTACMCNWFWNARARAVHSHWYYFLFIQALDPLSSVCGGTTHRHTHKLRQPPSTTNGHTRASHSSTRVSTYYTPILLWVYVCMCTY